MKSNEIFICLDYSDWCKSSSHKELKLIEFVDIKKSRKGEKHDEWKLWLWYLYNWLTFPCRISTFFHHQNNGIYKSPHTTKRKKEFTGAEVVSTQVVMNVKWKRACTMLQKLSKCEVKAWLCCNFIILPPPLRFYVKSNFGEFKRSKNVNFGNFRDSEL